MRSSTHRRRRLAAAFDLGLATAFGLAAGLGLAAAFGLAAADARASSDPASGRSEGSAGAADGTDGHPHREARVPGDPGGPTLRLADLVAEVRERSPLVEAARHRARAAAAVPARVSALDDPTLAWEAWNVPDSLRVDQADNNIFRLSQKIPFPGKRRLAGAVAEHEAAVAGREVESSTLDVVSEVEKAYWDLWRAHQNLAIYAREKDLAQRFARTAGQRYATDEATQADVLRAQVELTRVMHKQSTEELALDSTRAALGALLSRDPDTLAGAPEAPSTTAPELDLARLTALAFDRRPELSGQGAAIARDETGVELAERDRLPDFEVSVGRFVNHDANDGFGAMASITLPWANGDKYDAGIDEARARLAATRSDLRRLQDRIRLEVRRAVLEVRTAQRHADLFATTHIPQAEQALRVTEAGYQTGAVDFLSLLDTLRTIEMVHVEHTDAAMELGKALADLERAVGAPIDASAAEERDPRG